MLNKSDEFVLLSLNEDHFKIIQIKGSGVRGKINQVAAVAIKGLAEGDVVKSIQSATKKVNVKGSELVYVVSSSAATTKNIEIPSVNPEEIKSIVNLQASRHSPLSREEIQLGYINTGVYKANFTRVLLVIANRSQIKKNLGIFDKAGLKVRKVVFAPEGMAKFYAEAASLKSSRAVSCIIDLSKNATDITLIGGSGVAISSRGIPIGIGQLAVEGAVARDKLVDEINKTIESYKSDDIDQMPTRFILTNRDNHTKDLQVVLKEKFGWQTEINPYVDHVKASNGVLEQIAGAFADYSLLDLVGASCCAQSPEVNLIPDEIQLQKTVEDQGREIFATAFLSVSLLVGLACVLAFKWYFNSAYLNKLNESFKNNSKKVVELKNTSLKTNIIQEFLASRNVSLDVLNEFYANTPREIYLTNILMDENGGISLQGISDVPSLVFNLGSSLKESPLFKSVEIKSTTAKKDRNKDVSAFEITLKLKSALDEEKPKAKVEDKK